jgi:Raf kinase inhibitor-like YbhB/YbcL family protein
MARRQTLRPLAASLLALGLLGACGSPAATPLTTNPRTGQPPATPPLATEHGGSPSAPGSFQSPAFVAQGDATTIPRKFTCDGRDVSPPLAWTGVLPAPGPTEWAIVMDDPDANGFIHWVVAGIPGNVTTLEEDAGATSSPYAQGPNSFGGNGYRGPCPPPGRDHHYVFSLYAFSAPPTFGQHPTAQEVRAAGGQPVATLIATFGR